MIAIDTSALIAIVSRELAAEACFNRLMEEQKLLISAGTLAETLIVAGRRNLLDEINRLARDLQWDVVPVTLATINGIADAYATWGKGAHPAKLNLGDCFAYEVARRYDCPLLFVGDDFSKTDVRSALQGDAGSAR
ncbi:type II toxin-antitoxin system VapC family toxin [Phenylobacterium sp.]|uniref:type II toxin-antitoxin system VapC family toxin n=1 Tax=Phenylobacterium sp. TaxID=1871053 RepID=UPI00301D8B11